MNTTKIQLLIASTILAGCATAPPKPVVAPPPDKPAEIVLESKVAPTLPPAYTQKGVTVKIDGLTQAPDGGISGVSGTAKNVTASDLRYCQISLAFLDQAGLKLDDAKATTKSLKSGQVWHFQAALATPSRAGVSSISPDKVIAIPVKIQKADLANLN